MIRLSKKEMIKGYCTLKKCAISEFKEGNVSKALQQIRSCGTLAGQFNFCYSDSSLEDLLAEISHQNIPQIADYCPNEERWVFYDDFCCTFILGVQWIEALAKSGKQILYITGIDALKRPREITDKYINEFCRFLNVSFHCIEDNGKINQAKELLKTIVDYRASKIVLHKACISPIDLVLPSLPQGITKYIINLSDQTFWFGSKSIDYVFEFRPFGASVSLQRRGLKESQLLMVPFYPANDNKDFLGYPDGLDTDKVIIFSGGDFYKTIDKRNTYWRLVKAILDNNPSAVFWFATKQNPGRDEKIKSFIKKNHFEKRFFYTKFRPDIYQVFSHCDIYMGTCPTSGSLMSQLAAVNSKPIIQYYAPGTPDDETEQAICINDTFPISFDNEPELLEEAKKLINDTSYRVKQGLRLRNAMIHREQFISCVLETIKSNKSQLPLKVFTFNYDSVDDRWLELEGINGANTFNYLCGLLKNAGRLKAIPTIYLKKMLFNLMSRISNGKKLGSVR